jgi:hypothetical protein
MSEPLIKPEPADPLLKETREFWRDIGKEMIRQTIASIDEPAKQIIGVAGILEGLYFHAIAFADLRGQVAGWAMIVYLSPIALLLVSLIAALLVFFPDYYRLNFNASEASRQVYERVVAGKLVALRFASGFLALGVGALFLAVLAYLGG